ncbi:MAG: hypothetical protein JEZ09_04020 [Salinivirgaceae bacterium]|nr:hypothetical protein [Salinivirgaceae bacterium]
MIKNLILSFSIFILVSANLYAQKCNYEKNEVDAVTDLLVKLTQPKMLLRVGGQPLYVKGQSIGTNKYLKLRIYNYVDFDVQEEREITFTLSNTQEITLYPRTMPVDSSKIDSYMNVSTLLVYKLSSDQYLQLKDNAIVKFKYYLDSGFVEEKIKEKNQYSIMTVLRCLE